MAKCAECGQVPSKEVRLGNCWCGLLLCDKCFAAHPPCQPVKKEAANG